MDWDKVKVSANGKLSKLHNFMYMVGGKNFILEINEYADGRFVGYAELTNDDSFQFEPANGASVEECVSKLISVVEKK